ncbi:MAG: hypothetical protein AAFX00_11650, partial [Pseudomonadota bacterium]
MLRFDHIEADYQVTEAFMEANPVEPVTHFVRWLSVQDQHVWAQVILSFDGRADTDEEVFVFWLIDQPLELASAIRLFWKLFDPDIYLGREAIINNEEQGGPRVFAALRTLSDRIAEGYYEHGQLGIPKDEARYYRLNLKNETRAAIADGWTAKNDASFHIPARCVEPLSGMMPEKATLRPVTLPRDTARYSGVGEDHVTAGEYLSAAIARAPAEYARMMARLKALAPLDRKKNLIPAICIGAATASAAAAA